MPPSGSFVSFSPLREMMPSAEVSGFRPHWVNTCMAASASGVSGQFPLRVTLPERAGTRASRKMASSGSTGREKSAGMMIFEGDM